jgi:hypothetical protein
LFTRFSKTQIKTALVKLGFTDKNQIYMLTSLGIAEAAVYLAGTPLMINSLGTGIYTAMTWITGKPYNLLATHIANRLVFRPKPEGRMQKFSKRLKLSKTTGPATTSLASGIHDIIYTLLQLATAILIYLIARVLVLL